MPGAPLDTLLSHLRRLAAPGGGGETPDRLHVQQFIDDRGSGRHRVRGQLTAVLVPARVVALDEGALSGVLTTKLIAVVTLFLGLTLLTAGAATLALLAPPETEPSAANNGKPASGTSSRTDRYGEPLPAAAVSRLGSLRFRLRDADTFAVSPDGQLTAGLTGEGVSLWETPTGKVVRRLGRSETLGGVAFSPDGKRLAAGEFKGVRVWEVATGREIGFLPATLFSYGPRLLFSPDGKILAVGHSRGLGIVPVTVWDVAARKELWRYQGGDGGTLYPVAFTPDGKTLVVGQNHGTTVFSLDAHTGAPRGRLKLPPPGPGFILSSDGNTLALGGGGWRVARLWDIATGKARDLDGCPAGEAPRALSPDGTILVSTGPDNVLRWWDVATGKEMGHTSGAPGRAPWLKLLPDKRRVAFTLWDQNVLRFWDLTADREPHPPAGHLGAVMGLAYRPDGRRLFSAGIDHTLRSWDVPTARELSPPLEHPCDLWCLALAPDGKLLASGGANSPFIWIRDPDTGREMRRLEGFGKTQCLAFSPIGQILVSGRMGGTPQGTTYGLQLWEAATGKELRRITCSSCPNAVAFSPDGQLIASAAGRSLHLWQTATGRESIRIDLPAETWVSGVAFAPDGRAVAAGGSHQVGGEAAELITLWEAATGKQRLSVAATPLGGVRCVTFSPDGRLLATGGSDRKVHLWDVATGKGLRSFVGHQESIATLAFAPDGHTLASGSGDTTVLLWKVPEAAAPREATWGAPKPEEWDDAWRMLASADAAGAYRAMVSLEATPSCVAFLRERLRPAVAPNAGRVARLIADLDSDRFTAREAASRELEALGELGLAALQKALAGQPSLETRRRLEGLLAKIGGPVNDPEAVRALRAVEVLEHIGTPEARQLLRILAGGAPEARLSRDARASLERLAKRSPASEPGERRHPSP